jgi:hypothetical protein
LAEAYLAVLPSSNLSKDDVLVDHLTARVVPCELEVCRLAAGKRVSNDTRKVKGRTLDPLPPILKPSIPSNPQTPHHQYPSSYPQPPNPSPHSAPYSRPSVSVSPSPAEYKMQDRKDQVIFGLGSPLCGGVVLGRGVCGGGRGRDYRSIGRGDYVSSVV